MTTDLTRIVVATGATPQTTQVSHRDFPEIRSEGDTATEAAKHLVSQLTRALDSALTTWRRETLEHAIADVRAFTEHQN